MTAFLQLFCCVIPARVCLTALHPSPLLAYRRSEKAVNQNCMLRRWNVLNQFSKRKAMFWSGHLVTSIFWSLFVLKYIVAVQPTGHNLTLALLCGSHIHGKCELGVLSSIQVSLDIYIQLLVKIKRMRKFHWRTHILTERFCRRCCLQEHVESHTKYRTCVECSE